MQAVSARRRSTLDSVDDGAIVHWDAWSEYTPVSFAEKRLDLRLTGSVGRVGTVSDNALIDSTIGR